MVARNHITWLAKSFSDLVVDRALAFSPMMGLAIQIELANVVAVQRLHDADPNIVGPPSVATRIRASIAACYSGAPCSAFGSLVM